MCPDRLERPDPAALRVGVGLGLAALVLFLYARGAGSGFVLLDDDAYIRDNPVVRSGLTWRGFAWAFGTHVANWHPLTWISHMLDCELFGVWAGGHHLVSALLHAASAVVLLAALLRMTGALWPSGLMAALFAVHPLRVESVAWVAERKDVLSGLFWMLALLAYGSYAHRPAVSRYARVFAALALGLAAKPMLVTLPLVLLLLDFWPLGRWRPHWSSAFPAAPAVPLRWLIAEKLPLAGLCLASAAVTLAAQRRGGAVSTLESLPLGARALNALVAYATYLWKTIWPTGLAFFYPHPAVTGESLGLRAACAGLVLAGLTAAAALSVRRRPYLVVGWLWYVITLAPVAGLIQVGRQARADRYAYLPLIGIYVAIAWGAAELAGRRPRARPALIASAVAALAALSACTWLQVGYWKNTRTLAERALRVTEGNFVAHGKMGMVLEMEGRLDEAAAELQEALAIDPEYAEALINLGVVRGRQGELAAAQSSYERALVIEPDNAVAHSNLGGILARGGRLAEAAGHLDRALRLRPDFPEAHNSLGTVLMRQGDLERAAVELERALALAPDLAEAENNLGNLLQRQGRLDEARSHYERVIAGRPDYAPARRNLGVLLERQGRLDAAAEQFERVASLMPGDAEAHYNLGIVARRLGRLTDAEEHLGRAIGLDPAHARAHNSLGAVYVLQGELDRAAAEFARAVELDAGLAEAHYNLGAVLSRRGDRRAAAARFAEALRLDPGLEAARTALAALGGTDGGRER